MPVDEAHAFLIRSAEALHRFGTAANRLEAALGNTAIALGVELNVFATPTSLTLAFGEPGAQQVTLLRVVPAETDLGRLADLDALMTEVASHRMTPHDGRARIDRIVSRRRRYPLAVVAIAGGASSAGAAVLFGGSVGDVVVGGVLGLITGMLEIASARNATLARVLLATSAFVATGGARVAAAWWPEVHPAVAALSAIVVLLPGLAFTTAIVELGTANLASGVARLAGAGVTLVGLILGAAIAQNVIPLAAPSPIVDAVPAYWTPVVLVVAPLCFGVVLNARRKDLLVIVIASMLAWMGSAAGAARLGPEVGAGVGAFLLSTFANAYARILDRPATVPLVAGSILLVPGSLGFRSLAALLAGDVLVGVEQAFQMAMIASALAAGMLFGAAIVPTRRAL